MKRLRLSLAAGILTMMFAVSTGIAGQMPMGVTSPPPPPTEASATGNMPCGFTATSSSDASVTGNMPQGATSTVDPLTAFTLSLLQRVLSLF